MGGHPPPDFAGGCVSEAEADMTFVEALIRPRSDRPRRRTTYCRTRTYRPQESQLKQMAYLKLFPPESRTSHSGEFD